MKNNENITLGSLFDGIGGFPYAASFYGIKTLWASEIIPAVISVTRRHFPEMEHVGDITKLNGGKLASVDIITFGSPCQSFSIAGNRSGLEGKSGLFWEAIRIIREMREATNGQYPRYCIFENVPGILSATGGRDYKTVLEAFTETEIPLPPSGRWTNAGMVRGGRIDFAWVLHDAQYFGLAQRRKRLFAVCDFTGQRAAEILFKPKSLFRYFAKGGAEGKRTSPNAQGSINGAKPDGVSDVAAFMGGQSGAAGSIAYNEKKSPTLKSGAGGNMVPCVCEPQFYNEDTINKDIEASVVVINDQGGDSLTIEKTALSPTLRSEAHGNLPIVSINTGQIECTLINVTKNSEEDVKTSETDLCSVKNNRHNPNPSVCGTLCAKSIAPNGIGNEADMCILQQLQTYTHLGHGHYKESDVGKTLLRNIKCDSSDIVAYCLQGNMIGREDKNGPQGSGVNEDISFTLNTIDRHAVFSRQRSDEFQENHVTATQAARQSKDATDLVVDTFSIDCRNLYENEEKSGTLNSKSTGGYSLNYQNPIRKGYIVRRLTPVECELLQGYPIGWTEYGHDGKPLCDTARYQALGNSVAVPCVAYVLSGIVDEFQDK